MPRSRAIALRGLLFGFRRGGGGTFPPGATSVQLPMARHFAPSVRVAFLSVALTAAAAAQPPSPPDSAPPVLSGPRVKPDTSTTLVHTDMQGRFVKVEGRPEAAALAQLTIDPERLGRARGVIDARDDALRKHLVDSIDLIKETSDATKAGDKATLQRLGRELCDRFDPEQARDPLLAPLCAVLAPEEAAALTKLVDDYWRAWLDAEQRSNPGQRREAIQSRLRYELFQAEIAPVFQYTLRPFQQKLDRIYEAVDPTPEQRAAIRAAVITYIREGKLKPSESQREQLVRTIYDSLDEDRRIKLMMAAITAL